MATIHNEGESLVFDTRPILMQKMNCLRASLGKRERCGLCSRCFGGVGTGFDSWVPYLALRCFDHFPYFKKSPTMFSTEERPF